MKGEAGDGIDDGASLLGLPEYLGWIHWAVSDWGSLGDLVSVLCWGSCVHRERGWYDILVVVFTDWFMYSTMF